MENQFIILAYSIYLPISLALTLFVAKSLFKNAKVFMLDIFHGKEEIANSTNKLFEMGFYLMNIGFALLILEIDHYTGFNNSRVLIETLASKLGGFSIYLGIILFLNLMLFFRGRRKANASRHYAQQNTKTLKDLPPYQPM